jgi:hypothetical protein
MLKIHKIVSELQITSWAVPYIEVQFVKKIKKQNEESVDVLYITQYR